MTGASGFLGSNVLRALRKNNHDVCILVRETSNLSRINDIVDDVDKCLFKNLNDLDFKAELVIHLAWQGVSANDRNNFETQIKNLTITKNLLSYCKANSVNRIIGTGSQAEYGFYENVVDERCSADFDTHPYGLVKNLSRLYIENFCNQYNIGWTWLRLFSFYGPDEDPKWFIPWLISNIINENKIEMTEGKQRYAYMHVDDFSRIFLEIINSSKTINNTYNICSENDLSLKEISILLKDIIKPNTFNIEFGAKPYRDDQIMVLKGNISKLLNHLNISSLNEKLFQDNMPTIIKKIKNEI